MISKLAIGIIKAYQLLISPLIGPSCRYFPTCSEFAKQCIKKNGVGFSFFPIIKRLFSCHPFSKKPFVDPAP
tara:strand:- start:363 stop:578 length:216 start_codon:yes stop_codon:yes gene_type:complete